MASYPNCLVTKFSVSAFIACADVKGPAAPRFSSTQKGKSKNFRVLNVLTDALNTISCSYCPLAENIRNAADGRGLGDFASYLCNQFHPVDAGICCLRQCLQGVSAEHSIEAFCNGRVKDLMNAPLVPNNCVSNKVRDDPTNGGDASSDSGVSDSNTDSGDESNSETNSNDSSTSLSEEDTTTSTNVRSTANNTPSTTSSTPFTTSPTTSGAAATGTTSTSTLEEAQGTSNRGADSGRRATYADQVKRLCIALLPIVAGF
ncbi:MAG: hypothetical protein Q9210_002874 [Variospora velana]